MLAANLLSMSAGKGIACTLGTTTYSAFAKGTSTNFLAHDLGKNDPGEKVFITGISGGVGQLLSQMLIADGIEVYGSASSES
jgi:NADPH:quinone reductase-like Zn-dependent oxidoreductase